MYWYCIINRSSAKTTISHLMYVYLSQELGGTSDISKWHKLLLCGVLSLLIDQYIIRKATWLVKF